VTSNSQNSAPAVLALDAMGVIYEIGDDVTDLLIPFIREHGGIADSLQIEAVYKEASLGRMPASEFWRRVSVPVELENDYLSRFRLSDCVHEFLELAVERFERVICLSNDLSEWSRHLRQRFDLEPYFSGCYISGDLGVRKPDRQIYERMLMDLNVDPGQVLFVDDRVKNLDTAAELAIQTIYYDVGATGNSNGHRTISSLAEIFVDQFNDQS
jgi:putative hydrolase of the HAD superfamily